MDPARRRGGSCSGDYLAVRAVRRHDLGDARSTTGAQPVRGRRRDALCAPGIPSSPSTASPATASTSSPTTRSSPAVSCWRSSATAPPTTRADRARPRPAAPAAPRGARLAVPPHLVDRLVPAARTGNRTRFEGVQEAVRRCDRGNGPHFDAGASPLPSRCPMHLRQLAGLALRVLPRPRRHCRLLGPGAQADGPVGPRRWTRD